MSDVEERRRLRMKGTAINGGLGSLNEPKFGGKMLPEANTVSKGMTRQLDIYSKGKQVYKIWTSQ